MWLRTPVVAICVLSGFHNGSIFRNSLPLREDGRKDLQILLGD